ncbi:MAG: hypothetical protein EXR66_05450 [Dehalococcoidia bacterium]|nr:hypothetical protein [Dehalococcoidia bacterium]
MSVDTFAAQHPGGAHPDKSIAIHLVGLYLVLSRGVPTSEIPRRHKHLAATVHNWPHCAPPNNLGSVRVVDVAQARSAGAHIAAARAWAASVWRAWAAHHSAIEEFARGAGVANGATGPVR